MRVYIATRNGEVLAVCGSRKVAERVVANMVEGHRKELLKTRKPDWLDDQLVAAYERSISIQEHSVISRLPWQAREGER